MKLSITQIVLGILIVLTACYIVWWMIFGVTELLNLKILNESGVMVTDYTPENEVLFTIARYASGLLLGLGLVVLVNGVLWKKVENKTKLAITQIVAGALTVALSAFILIWGYSFDFIIAVEGGPVLDLGRARGLTFLTSLLGLAVLGVGIAQFINARKKTLHEINLEKESLI
jgi:hypothetical protein